MHLAAAVKVPNQIVIEAPTLNPTNVPWQNPYRLIRNPVVNGRNLDYYRYDGKPIKGTQEELIRCMESVPVDEVYQAVDSALRSLTFNSPHGIWPQSRLGIHESPSQPRLLREAFSPAPSRRQKCKLNIHNRE
jgi:hypothetical protein